jgi:hypothetical protein
MFFFTETVVFVEIGCTFGRTVSGSGFNLTIEQSPCHIQRRNPGEGNALVLDGI